LGESLFGEKRPVSVEKWAMVASQKGANVKGEAIIFCSVARQEGHRRGEFGR